MNPGLNKIPPNTTAPHVVVAMSGGVDSSVCASLLLQKGYRVSGVSLRFLAPGCSTSSCCSESDLDDARTVAAQLGILWQVISVDKLFEQRVIAPFCNSYLSGRTPSPCIDCNHELKFGYLLDYIRQQLGADFLATGHYARITGDAQAGFQLKAGIDTGKDQSYFLFSLNQEMLSRTLFPLGHLHKSEVRELARKISLHTAPKKESQEICFVDSAGYGQFVYDHSQTKPRPGPIKDATGQLLGRHRGLAYYTIGQRRGLGVATGQKCYVVEINAQSNTLVIGPDELLWKEQLTVPNPTWTSGHKPELPCQLLVRIRSRHKGCMATIAASPQGGVLVSFAQPQRAITPGQAAVFYQDDQVIGGGWIDLFEAIV